MLSRTGPGVLRTLHVPLTSSTSREVINITTERCRRCRRSAMSDEVWLVPPDGCSAYVRQANYLQRAALLLSQLRYVICYANICQAAVTTGAWVIGESAASAVSSWITNFSYYTADCVAPLCQPFRTYDQLLSQAHVPMRCCGGCINNADQLTLHQVIFYGCLLYTSPSPRD